MFKSAYPLPDQDRHRAVPLHHIPSHGSPVANPEHTTAGAADDYQGWVGRYASVLTDGATAKCPPCGSWHYLHRMTLVGSVDTGLEYRCEAHAVGEPQPVPARVEPRREPTLTEGVPMDLLVEDDEALAADMLHPESERTDTAFLAWARRFTTMGK